MLKLRSIGLSDYSVLEGRQRIGRIRLATERMPCLCLWSITVHLPGGLPIGSAKDIDTAKAEFKAAWEVLKARNHATYPGDEHPRQGLTCQAWLHHCGCDARCSRRVRKVVVAF
jgi:hypothetical protein